MTPENRLTSTETWFELYEVMCDLDDDQLSLACGRLENGPRRALVDACLRANGQRLAGWLAANDSAHLEGLVEDARRRLFSLHGTGSTATVRLIDELRDVMTSMPPNVVLAAADLATQFISYSAMGSARTAFAISSHAAEVSTDGESYAAALNLISLSSAGVFFRHGDHQALDGAIAAAHRAIEQTPPGNVNYAGRLTNLSSHLANRFEIRGDVDDIRAAATLAEQAVSLTHEHDAQYLGRCSAFASRLHDRFEAGGELADLAEAIRHQERVLAATVLDERDKPADQANMSSFLWSRYQATGAIGDLNAAIEHAELALEITSPADARKPGLLGSVASFASERYRTRGAPEDLDIAVDHTREASQLASPDDSNYASFLSNLGAHLLRRHSAQGASDDLEQAILAGQKALSATSPESPSYRGRLSNLAEALAARYAIAGEFADLETAVALADQAFNLVDCSDSGYASAAATLASMLTKRHAALGQSVDLYAAIRNGHEALTAEPAASVKRAELLLHQAVRLWTAQDDQAAVITDEWCDLIGRGGGSFYDLTANTEVFINLLFHHRELKRAARIGQLVLNRAASFNSYESGQRRFRSRLDGVASLTALALLRTERVREAADVIESVSGALARLAVSTIDWTRAAERAPELASTCRDLQSKIEARSRRTDPGLDRPPSTLELEGALSAGLRDLRRELGVPEHTPTKTTQNELVALGGSHTWIVATAHGGAAIHRRADSWSTTALPDLTVGQISLWQQQLHPESSSNDVDEGSIRGPVGGGIPTKAAVHEVCDGLSRMVLTHLDHVTTAPPEVSDDVHWLIPFGITRPLPWQARLPHLRLHLSAAHTLTIADSKRDEAPLLVIADPNLNLQGAKREAQDLAELGAEAVTGSDATFERLCEIAAAPTVHRLHFAGHGNATPGIDLADQALDINNAHRLGGLFAVCQQLTINACTSAAHASGHSDDNLSLATIAHSWGTRISTVALWPLDDEHARTWARSHHLGQPPPLDTPTTFAYQTYG